MPIDLFKKIWLKYHSDGIISVTQAAKQRIFYHFRNRILDSRLFKGKVQYKLYTNLRYQLQRIKYRAPADPWTTIDVEVASVDYQAKVGDRQWGLGRIKDGDWDRSRNLYPVDEHLVVKGVYERFEQGLPWKETAYVNDVAERMEERDHKWNYTNVEEFINIRCSYVDTLFDSIKEHGYRKNSELRHDVPSIDQRSQPTRFSQRLEPLVAIGRNGEIYWVDGFHRFAIASVLDINTIPVQVICRHDNWQKFRESIAAAERDDTLDPELDDYANHPDLQDLLHGEEHK